MGNLSSTKPVPGAKKVGNCWRGPGGWSGKTMMHEKAKWKRTSHIWVNRTQAGFRESVMNAIWVSMVLLVYTELSDMKLAG